jgi:hypothetical protein
VRGVSKTLIAALAVLLLAVGLAACGGGGDDSSSNTTEASAQGQAEGGSSGAAPNQDEGKGGGDQGKATSGDGDGQSSGSKPSGGDASDFVPKQHSDSGGGSQQFRVKGGDNSVQEFGAEADTSELDAAATALHNFLDARAEANWAAACEYMSKGMIESIEKLGAKAEQTDTSCGGILAAVTNPAARDQLKAEAEQADVGSLRIEDGNAFVIYTGPEGVVFAMPMVNEGGAWKVTGLAATPLS